MTVEVPKQLAEDASPTAHKQEAKDKIEARMKDTGNEILLEKLRNQFNGAVEAKGAVQDMQIRSFKAYMTGQFEELDDELDRDHHINFVKTLLRNIRSRLSDANAVPIAAPRKPDDWHVANMMNSTMKYILDANGWRDIEQHLIFDALVKGDAFLTAEWNKDMGEDGNVELSYVDALRMFPGSSTRKMADQGSIFILHSDPLHKVVERFPAAEMEAAASAGGGFPVIGQEDSFFRDIPSAAFKEHGFEKFENQAFKAFTGGHEGDDPITSFEDNVNYVEAFLNYPKGHPLKDKFPNGRRTFFTDVAILSDKRWDNAERNPYVQFSVETEGSGFWHQSIVKQLASPQKVVNQLSNLVVKSAKRSVNTPLIHPNKGGLDEFEFLDEAMDKVLHLTPLGAQQTRYLEPPPFPDAAMQVMDMYSKLTEQLSGVQDISQGRVPGSLQSGEAIDLLQEAAQTIIRHLMRPMQSSIKRMGECLADYIQNHFDSERVIRTGDKEHNQFITLNKSVEVQEAKKELMRAADQQGAQQAQRALQLAAREQGMEEELDQKTAEIVINDPTLVPVDIRVGAGGDKLSRVGRLREAKMLFEMGAIDERALLRVADFENKDEVLERVEEKRQLAQQVKGLQDRLESQQKAMKEVMSQLDRDGQRQLLSALQGNR